MSSASISVSAQPEHHRRFKILVVGPAGVGKTAFVHRHRTGAFDKAYIATMGVEVVPLSFYTTKGLVELMMWDCAGKAEYAGLGDYYWNGADGAILMFDVSGLPTYRQIPALHRAMMEHNPDLPVVLCGNKVDCRDRQVKPEMITYHRRAGLQYYDISARSCYNFEKPILYLLRKLMGDPELAFVEAPPVHEAVTQEEQKIKQEHREEMVDALSSVLQKEAAEERSRVGIRDDRMNPVIRAQRRIECARQRLKDFRYRRQVLEERREVTEVELRDARHWALIASKDLRLARLELRLVEQQVEINALKAAAK